MLRTARRTAAALLLAAAPVTAQQAKKPLTLEDYPRWSRITEVELSPDGRWLTYAYAPVDGDATFHVRRLEDEEPAHTATNGADPAFSKDSRWVAYIITPGEKEAEKLRKEKKPVPRTLELIELDSGEKRTEKDVQSFTFSESSRWLAIEKRAPEPSGEGREGDARTRGHDVVLIDLTTGSTRNIGNVAELAFNETGSHLAYLVDAKDKAGNGLYLLDLAGGLTNALDTDTLRYEDLAWSDDGTDLAALKGETPEGQERRANVLIAFGDVSLGGIPAAAAGDGGIDTWSRMVYDPSADPDFPEGMVLSELARLAWREDGRMLVVGIKEQVAKPEKKEGDAEPAANVDVWHWKDERVQSVQQVQASGDRRYTHGAVVHVPTGEFVRLADDAMRRTEVPDRGAWAIGYRDAEYRARVDVQPGERDIVRIDLDDGDETTLASAVRFPMGTSPDGRRILFFQRDTLWLTDLESGRTRNLSAEAGVSFVSHNADYPAERFSYGLAGWSRDGRSVLVNHRWDIWSFPLEGAGEPTRYTAGAGERDRVVLRLVPLDEEDREEGFDTSRPLIVEGFGEWSKESGWLRVPPGGGEPRRLLWGDYAYDGLRKAEDADRVVFTRQTFTEFPDLYAADLSLRGARRLTDANPQQAEYAWSPGRVLVEYTDDRGHRLQGTLALPAGYEEGEKYPMVVYFYEQMSDRHHRYDPPRYDDRPHGSTYTSQGYLFFQPDIVYDDGRPGLSALDDITSAVERVIELGYADPERIGLQGHSWGGYQSSFIVTQTDLFAAVVTGAPLTNLVSMHNVLYKRTGGQNAPIIQWSQGRMGVTPWEDWDLYVSQSPVHQAEGITTPFLILHGTEDGAVDWNQGLEFYTAARRLGKEVILLSYPGEPHHLEKEENQKDFQRRMREYFDHYLKGAPAPEWMKSGRAFLDKERELP